MKFRKGTKVEVLTQKDMPSGSWRCAEIIGGDGDNYTVRYNDDTSGFRKEINESMLRKAIRPCPPSVHLLEDWVTGDVVEVFHNFSWKMATVLKVSGGNHVLVRILGSVIELKASRHNVRARLCWLDGEWIVIGKVSNKCEDLRGRLLSSRKDNAVPQKVDITVRRSIKGDDVLTRDNKIIVESQNFHGKTLKRKQSHLQLETDRRHNKKNRVEKKDSVMQQPRLLPEKVDDLALSQKSIRPFYINKTNGCLEIISERVKKDGYSYSMRLKSNDDDDSVSSSVGSCSLHRNDHHDLHYVYRARPLGDSESRISDCESVCHLKPQEGNFILPAKEGLSCEIHRLELHAYHSIIEALHASGPLSWEHELLLTNLRHSLHISSDEHLTEIRNLVSSSSCIPC